MKAIAESWPAWTGRGLIFSGLWMVISGGHPASWTIGAPAVLFATWAHSRLGSAQRWQVSPLGTLRFVGYFLLESLRGGLGVAARTLRPRLRIRPGFTSYYCSLPAGRPIVFFGCCVNLLPGTLLVDLQGQRLLVHLLDIDSPAGPGLARLEQMVARLFALEWEPRHA